MGKLTDVVIRAWVKSGETGKKVDGDGLALTLSKAGTAAWIFRYSLHTRRGEVSLGRYPDIGLAKARELAGTKRALVQQGIDPAAELRRAKMAGEGEWTFRALAADYLEKVGDRLAKSTVDGRRQQLRDYVYPKIGNLPAAEVAPVHIVEIVEATAVKSLHVARLVLIAVREVFAHGIARHVVQSDPTAHIKARAVIGGRPVQRERVMLSDAELAAMFAELPTLSRACALQVRILLSTGVRIGELVRARWEHVDLERSEWTIPPEHSKTRRGFVVPLTPAVAGWFAELQPMAFSSAFVLPLRARFNGTERDDHSEITTLNTALTKMAPRLAGRCRRFTPHDLRATCRSHLAALGVDVLIAERCLNHALGGLVAVYDKHDYLSERRRALELWSAKLAAIESGRAFNVRNLKRA